MPATALDFADLLEKLRGHGYDVVRIGTIPFWLEKVESIPAPVYRLKVEYIGDHEDAEKEA